MKLDSTAALVMQWTSHFYKKYPACEFLKHLDLSKGNDLFKKCSDIFSEYNEVIANRKYIINKLIRQIIGFEDKEFQIVILAAGMCPLALDLLAEENERISMVFEIDMEGMDEKKRIYHENFPEYSRKIKCISSDITSNEIISHLTAEEINYNPKIPTIILAEGISYYLSKNNLFNLIKTFANERNNYFIIEYLVPYNQVNNERRHIPEDIFNIIKKECDLSEISFYTKDELYNFFTEVGGDVVNHYNMSKMESERLGHNCLFKNSSDGWIECISANL